MKRPWQVWLAFALCAAVLAAAMGWLTAHALRVDRERSAARAEAELEQRVSLALWRMDTKLAPLIAEEIARPQLFYDSFIAVNAPAGKGDAVQQAPSPLLNAAPNVLLNFDASIDGQWKSPQAPPQDQTKLALSNGMTTDSLGENRKRLAELSSKVDVAALAAQLPAEPLPQFNATVPMNSSYGLEFGGGDNPFEEDPFGGAEQRPFLDYGEGNRSAQAANAPPPQEQAQQRQAAAKPPLGRELGAERQAEQVVEASPSKGGKGYADFGSRKGRYEQAAQQEFTKQRNEGNYLLLNSASSAAPAIENASRPLWVGGQLLLARRVERGGQTFVQGSWLDWPRLKDELLAETADLLPKADLVPVRNESDGQPTRMLAGLPVQLVVTDTAATLAGLSGVDAPLQWSLGMGWIAIGLAVAAVGALLWGVLALSERRAAFVSSVTHELRTPLTTFRMYAEMLARDMAPPESRREYLETLKTESERLTHLVENVLAYARLERGRRPKRNERTTPAALVERLKPRLSERAARSQMELECAVDAGAGAAPMLTDIGVVEQILFNLVDNAAKYAARGADPRIRLEAARDGDFVALTVRDHGPGFASPREAARSAPFSKSAQEAAETAPGVGLGLALCRRLARELGGRLEICARNGDGAGAAVTLRLPIER
jgi:signal transduction histidine kinase